MRAQRKLSGEIAPDLEALALGDSVYVERLKEADALHPSRRQYKNLRN